LRDIFEENSSNIAAVGESRFQLQTKRDIGCASYGRFAEPRIWHATICAFQCRVWRAFAADARIDLYPSNLIQGR
jgi:hypothetical protein